jgi:hypothetical protein
MKSKKSIQKFYAHKYCKFCGVSMADHAYPYQLCEQAREVADKLMRSGCRGKALRAAFTANVIQDSVSPAL